MSGIILPVRAEKVINKGGGHKTQDTYRTRDQHGRKVRHYQSTPTPSFGYVIFNCPKCGKRNKRAVTVGERLDNGEKLGYTCNGCCARVEVSPPISLV